MTFLTKPEPFVAAAVAVLVGFGLTTWQHQLTRRRALGLLTAWLAGASLVVLAAFMALRCGTSTQTALRGVLGSWPYMQNHGATFFNNSVMGSDDPIGNLVAMLKVLPWYGVMLLPLALYVPSRATRNALLALGLGSLAAAAACGSPDLLRNGLRPLPLVMCALAIALGSCAVRSRDTAEAQATTRKLMLTVFAGLLLARIFLRTNLLGYGFVLAAPATLVLIIAWLAWLPAWLSAQADRLVYKGAVLGIIVLFVLDCLICFRAVYEERCEPVGRGADAFVGDPRCEFAAPVLAEIRRRVRPGETLCVLPEGIMINYLARVESSVPYDSFIPPILEMFGEHQIIASFQAHPPDYVLLLHRSTPEYGAELFGRDYGRELYSWVIERYCPAAEHGLNPMTEDGEGFILMVPKGTSGCLSRH